MPPQTTKQPTGPFNRDNLLSYLKQQAESSKVSTYNYSTYAYGEIFTICNFHGIRS